MREGLPRSERPLTVDLPVLPEGRAIHRLGRRITNPSGADRAVPLSFVAYPTSWQACVFPVGFCVDEE